MKAVFLGTNGWYDSETGSTTSVLVLTEHFDIIFDAGSGIRRLNGHYRKEKPVFLFLSHFHLDHIFGLHILPKFDFRKGLIISGPKGIRSVLPRILDTPFTMPLAQLPFPVQLLEMPKDEATIPFPIQCRPLQHVSPCIGYRIQTDGFSIAYITDTQYCDNAVDLSRNADLLISECALPPGRSSRKWPHLNPQDAARIAKEADARRLILIHFDASEYMDMESREIAGREAARIFPNVRIARDGMDIDLDDGKR